MRSGKLDKKVQVQRRTKVRDPASGELVETWANLGLPLWAEKLEGRPLERYAAQQKIAEISTGWRLRWAPALITLTPDDHRLVYGSQTFDIKGLVEIQRRQGVVVLAMARGEGLTALGVAPVT